MEPCFETLSEGTKSMAKKAKPTASSALKKAEALKLEAAQTKRTATKLEKAEILRLGRLALHAGLGDVKVSDKKMAAGLSDLAERFL